MKTLPPATTTLPQACEPSLATHLTFFVVLRSMSSVPDLGLPGSNRSGRPLAGEYMLRPGSLPPQRGQSADWACDIKIKRKNKIERWAAEFLMLLLIPSAIFSGIEVEARSSWPCAES